MEKLRGCKCLVHERGNGRLDCNTDAKDGKSYAGRRSNVKENIVSRRTIENCKVVSNMLALNQSIPKVIDGKCAGFNASYYSPKATYEPCDKCNLILKTTKNNIHALWRNR